MEFDIEKNKVVGIVVQHRVEDHARIKVLGFINNDNKYTEFMNTELFRYFPHEGYLFEPGFFKNVKLNRFKEGDLIECKVTSIENVFEGGDHFRIYNNDAKKTGHRALELTDIKLKIQEVDFSNAKIVKVDFSEQFSEQFYGVIDNYIVGKIKLQHGKILPSYSKEVRKWEKKNCEIIEYDSAIFLISEPPKENGILLDAMDNEQLFSWFKKKLNQLNINKTALDYLNQNIKWQDNFHEILDDLTEDNVKLDRIRFERVVNNITQFDLNVSDIKELVNTSENLRKEFLSALERHKIELRQEYADEVEELVRKKEIEKQRLEIQLSKISIEIAKKNKELSDIFEEISSCNFKMESINSNKERILSDFSIIQEVLGNRASTGKVVEEIYEESFVIELDIPNRSAIQITQKDKFLARLKYFVNQQNINSSLAGNLIPVCTSYRGVFLKTIELGLAFIEATGNSKYIIQQVGPDWLHFKDIWKNGLEAIWNSSHENPEVLHFMILEDINLSSPECYMRPLLDCMNGIRKQIPFAKTAYPNNLRILATKISSEEPKIGLPLYQQTFKNWGAVGYIGNIEKPADQTVSFVDGYLNAATVASFMPDEFDLKITSSQVESEFDKLFEKF